MSDESKDAEEPNSEKKSLQNPPFVDVDSVCDDNMTKLTISDSVDTLDQDLSKYACINQSRSRLISAGYDRVEVEYALKVGYSEQLIHYAFKKLGPNPERNKLLQELIELGRTHNTPIKQSNYLNLEKNTNIFEVTLKPIFIDGSNVALCHGNGQVFSCKGIKICVDWFKARGHKEITVCIPPWRSNELDVDNLIRDQDVLVELNNEGIVDFIHSRHVAGNRIIYYDEIHILTLALENNGVVVSNNNFRDLIHDTKYRNKFGRVIEERLLMYSFINDNFVPPDDPLGRSGPTLEMFLKYNRDKDEIKGICPYGKKCTYGNKCKFSHPERGALPQKSVSEQLVENSQKMVQDFELPSKILPKKSLSVPLQPTTSSQHAPSQQSTFKQQLSRTKSTTSPPAFYSSSQQIAPFGSCSIPNMSAAAYYDPIQAPPRPGMRNRQNSYPLHLAKSSMPVLGSWNMHNKLQRQLSINPAGDPRIRQMKMNLSPTASTSTAASPPPFASHWDSRNLLDVDLQPYCRQDSAEEQQQASQSRHMNVFHMSSAPNISPSAAMVNRRDYSSTSDPHLFKSVGHSSPPSSANTSPRSFSERRNEISSHLKFIFPEYKVEQAMYLYPYETDPEKICSAILTLFPAKPT